MKNKALIAIVGRPHTGKSTLANNLVKRGIEITTDKAQVKHANVVILLVDASQIIDEGDVEVASEINQPIKNKILVLNKIDIVQLDDLSTQIEIGSHLGVFSEIIAISAKSEKDISKLVDAINRGIM